MTGFDYHKSTYSSAGGECVEVATNVPATVALRDSKHPAGPVLRLNSRSWQVFLTSIRANG